MIECLRETLRTAERMILAWSEQGIAVQPNVLHNRIPSPNLSSLKHRDLISNAISRLGVGSQQRLLALFDRRVEEAQRTIRAQWNDTMRRLPSVQDVGGMSDEQTGLLVCEAFERHYLELMEQMSVVVTEHINTHLGQLKLDACGGSFSNVSHISPQDLYLLIQADNLAHRLHPRICLPTQSYPQQRREHSSISNGRNNSNSSKSYLLLSLCLPLWSHIHSLSLMKSA